MFITGLGMATPARSYRQRDCWNFLQNSTHLSRLAPRSRAILKKVMTGSNSIESRHLALETLEEVFEATPDALQARFSKHAPALATQAALRALEEAQATPGEIDGVLVSTCTGYLCPGLSSYVSEALGLRRDVVGLDLVGQGCGAALPNLRAGEALLAGGRCQRVLSICVEICSAAFYWDDDPGVLISACLFGDGAAAAVLANQPCSNQRRVEWKTAASLHFPEEREMLRFEHRNGMLRNILSPCVPQTAARHARELFDRMAGGLLPENIAGWMLHAGGRDVLAAVQAQFGLTPQHVQWSADILRRYGNMSSPFVLFVLQSALASGARGGTWWLSSFGAGFSCHGAILEVE